MERSETGPPGIDANKITLMPTLTDEMRDTAVELGGHTLRLCPERAVHWPDGATLFVADPHFGKADLFRRRGIPVPHAAAEADLQRLSAVLQRTGASRLIVLGDLLHSRPEESDATVASVAAWRGQHRDIAMHLVRGNHDRHAGPPLDAWGMTWCDEPCLWEDVPFVLRHHPGDDDRGYVLCGHVHPSVTPLAGTREAMTRLPCFHATDTALTLPAFGGFTGTHRIRIEPGERVFAVAESSVIALPPGLVR